MFLFGFMVDGMEFDTFMKMLPYQQEAAEKQNTMLSRLLSLTKHHRESCGEYASMLKMLGFDEKAVKEPKDIPFLPVRLFKELSLRSVSDDQIMKTLTSSGTSGQKVSRIYLDRTTAANQQKALVKIVSDFTGRSRMPMLILDCPSVLKDRNSFSARGAGVLGFSVFGTKKQYALRDDMTLDLEGVQSFLAAHQGEDILLFGFTFMVWQYFYKELLRLKEQGVCLDLSKGILIHGGGWKKLEGEAVSRDAFKEALKEVCGLCRIHDYYGMAEQTGCIYMECECGHLHASIFSDVIVRDPLDFSVCGKGKRGILQVLSVIPESYPGHSLLTEDEGILLGEDDCPCGRKGKYFAVTGRLKKAEIRGCSDTFAAGQEIIRSDAALAATDGFDAERGMDSILNRVSFLCGDRQTVKDAVNVSPLRPFDEPVCAFLQTLSERIMKNREAAQYPDVKTFGFWVRKASISKMKERFAKTEDFQIGRGMAFHIAPSNVPVNFAYSLAVGLLCGNANIVRVPSKAFPQVELLASLIRDALDEHEGMKPYVHLVRYERDDQINALFSSHCDVRIIWGGDETIRQIRKAQLPARAVEVTFADRYSLSIIDAKYYVNRVAEGEHKYTDRVASDFYNDTYLSDQNACTSPQLIAWMGEKEDIDRAKEIFWDELCELAEEKYLYQPVQGIDKLTEACLAATESDVSLSDYRDNRLIRLSAGGITDALMRHRPGGGFFYEYDSRELDELRRLLDHTKCQTVSYIGNKNLQASILSMGLKGVDRVVPIGQTMDFDLIWDGYDLPAMLTRKMQIL